MTEFFKRFGSVVFSILLLVSFNGILLERDFCLPCGTETENILIFPEIAVNDVAHSCECQSHDTHKDIEECCAPQKSSHLDIVKISFFKATASFFQYPSKLVSKPFPTVQNLLASFGDNVTKFRNFFIQKRSIFSIDPPPNESYRLFICVFRN